MSGGEGWIQDLYEVIRGDRMEVWNMDHLLYAGTVDDVDPAHGVVWVLEDGFGERKMIHVQQYPLWYCPDGCSH